MSIFQAPELGPGEAQVLRKYDEIREGLRYALSSPKRWTGLLRRDLLARAIQGSNSIEGYHVTFEEAVAVVEGEQVDRQGESVAAVEGYRTALTYILQLSDDPHYTFNEELVRSLHFMMLSYDPARKPGRWRPGSIYVRREPSGEVVYDGPAAESVPGLMREFVAQVNGANASLHPVIRGAMAHLNLVMIHPFSDGNGRMGRAVQTLVLARDGILSPAFSSIEEYLGSRGNTEAYYGVLGQVGQGSWHPENHAGPWVHFCLVAHLQQATTVARRVKETEKLWNELEVELARRKLPERMISALYEAAIGLRVRSARYRVAADISSQVAARDLRTLVEQGLLTAKGEKKGRSYLGSAPLLALRQKTREPRVPLAELYKDQLTLPL